MSEINVNTIKDSSGQVDLLTYSNGSATGIAVSGGRKNLIINGAMQVAQRGTSFTGLTNGNEGYTLDRWKWDESGAPSAVMTVERSSDAPNLFASSLKTSVTTADAAMGAIDALSLQYKFEGQDVQSLGHGTSSAQSMTLSFWVKSNKTGTYTIWFYKPDGTRSQSKTYTVDSADTWEYKTITVSGDTSSAIANDNTEGLWLSFCLAVGSTYSTGSNDTWVTDTDNRYVGQTVNIADSTSNTFYITGVQLEVGTVATPFEHRSYGEELALCQRYYRQWGRSDGGNVAICNGMAYSSDEAYFAITLPVTMRAEPSVAYSALPRAYKPTTAQRLTSISINTNESDSHSIRMQGTNAGFFSAGNATWLQINTAGEWFALDAEL